MRGEDHGHNELSGTVHGSAVQAGTVYGGIHMRIGTEAAGQIQQTPWQLPPLVRITDRTEELFALEQHRARTAREGYPALAAVSGLGGVGKTAVALTWLHALRPQFPGGQLYADLGAQSPNGPADPDEVVAGFLRTLGVAAKQMPSALADRAAMYRSLVADRQLVVLLDDAATAAQVRPLLPGGQNVTAVTSRRRMPGLIVDGCYALHLEPLATEAAVELLEITLADGRVAAQPDEARALVKLCAGLPLAVRVAGARLAARPRREITTMVRALTEERGRLEALAIEGDHNVRATLDLSYRGLTPEAARLYRLMGLHPGSEFGTPVARAALASDAAELLDMLHDANLLVDAGEERYRFHDLVRLHAASKAEEEESSQERVAALRRMFDHYLATATRAEEIVDPQHRTMPRSYGAGSVITADLGDDAEGALDWLELELPNLMTVIQRARPAGFPAVAWQLADALWPLFLRRKFYDQWRAAHSEGLAAAEQLGDTAAQCRMLTSGGVGELGLGSHERALEMFESAARMFRMCGNTLGYARALNYQGLAHQRLGRLDKASELFARAAVELPACGDRRAGGLARLNLAEVALARGLPEKATADADAAYVTLREVGDMYNAARAATLLGRVYLARDLLDPVEDLLFTALSTLRGVAADYETARTLESLAQLAERRGQQDVARDYYREALDLYSSVGGSESAGAQTVRTQLAQLESRSGD
ncbi:NB-ARC domain-containing protein [Streptomyces luomodiensis]|uniref:NB-ARC domain-containing protein n=1 Tax=Streptomyces luomodiensis TaxID=3026192 RepID=A0ABY9USM1_9ACTN|nr:NB-ARC domain-containing protein [Streptomyces sp. SCA4-21]WNE95556.1 NB-ARC domain-containing protein [Streptomyces sp. SCA4-21]